VNGIAVALVPYDAGIESWRMGAGPDALFDETFRRRFDRDHPSSRIDHVHPETTWRTELKTTFDLHHRIAVHVRTAASDGLPSLIVAGDCSATVGVIAGLGAEQRVGVLWLDAHADFETPETDASGYLDGHALAMLTGRCWSSHTSSLSGFNPVPDHRVLLIGARDIGEAERHELRESGVHVLPADALRDGLESSVAAWASDIDRIHIHIDADVVDDSYGRANDWASSGGMSPDEVSRVIRYAPSVRPLVSAVIASWDPHADRTGALHDAMRGVALTLAEELRKALPEFRRPT
jgi:arginase